MAEESLGLLVYGPAGSGKTTVGLSGPTPTLVLDAEQASKFIPKSKKVIWEPLKNPIPPTYDGSWEYCVVRIDRWEIAEKVMQYIKGRNHPFKTILLDSVTEVVIKAKEAINNRDQFKIQHWGTLGANMGFLLRDLRDECSHPDSPIKILCIIAVEQEIVKTNISGDIESRKVEPFLEGGVKKIVSYLFDLTARLTLVDELADRSNPGAGYVTNQYFFTGKNPEITAKSRVPGLPPTLLNPTLTGLFNGVFGEEEPTPQPVPQAPAQAQPVAEEPTPQPEEKTSSSKSARPALPTLPTK